MFFTSSGSFEAEAGLHFQLPPTIGRRDMKRRAVRVTFIMALRNRQSENVSAMQCTKK